MAWAALMTIVLTSLCGALLTPDVNAFTGGNICGALRRIKHLEVPWVGGKEEGSGQLGGGLHTSAPLAFSDATQPDL